MERIRVLRAVTRFNIGGPALHVSILSTRLDPERFETLLVSGVEGAAEGRMQDLGRIGDLQVHRIPALGREVAPIADVRALWEMHHLVRRFRPHIVHTHLAKAGSIGRVAAWANGVPAIVHTYHGTVFRGYFGRAGSAAVRAAERALSRITHRIVAITPLQRRELIELGIGDERTVVEIPLGLDLDTVREPRERRAAREALGLDATGPVVGIVARLVPIKDVGTFLRAVALLPEDVTAAVVGGGEEGDRLRSLARELGIEHRVRFTGWQADMASVYAALDVVALSSLSEGSPVSLIEGMAAGCPVVSTAVGGVPDVVRHGETGLLVAPREPRALADAIRAVLSDRDLAERLAASGRVSVYPRLDASRLVRDITRLYEELMTSHAQNGA